MEDTIGSALSAIVASVDNYEKLSLLSADLTNFPTQHKEASLGDGAVATDHPSTLGARLETILANWVGAYAAALDAVFTVILAAVLTGSRLLIRAVSGFALRAFPAVGRTHWSLTLRAISSVLLTNA